MRLRDRLLSLWLSLLMACAASHASAASTPALEIDSASRYDVAPVMEFLEDETARMSFDQVLSAEAQGRFKPVGAHSNGVNFGFTRSAIWLRARLQVAPTAPGDWIAEIAYPPLDRFDLHVSVDGNRWADWNGGDLLPFSARAIPHRNHVMPVTLVPGHDAWIYLRIESEGTVTAPLRLWRPQALWAQDQATYSIYSLYFGLLIGLFLYNLLLFSSVRDPGYLIYVVFVAAMGLGQAALTGMGAQFLWPEWAWWNSVSVPVGMTATAFLGLVFARHFLSSSVRMPQLDKIILVLLAGWLVALIVSLTLSYRASTSTVTVLALASVVALVTISIVSVLRGFAGARYFATAWALLLVGVVTLVLHNSGFLPSNVITAHSLLIGSALEMVLFSFALADRINVARRFKEVAQARIAAEKSMVQALSQSQAQLKTALDEREIILESSVVGIAYLTPDGRLRWANRKMGEIFGADPRKVRSIEPFYCSREQYLQMGGEVAEAVTRGEVFERDLDMRHTDGRLVRVRLTGRAVRRDDLSQGTVWAIMELAGASAARSATGPDHPN